MDINQFDEYKKNRYEVERDWYDNKSVSNRQLDRFVSVSVIVLAAIVPLVVLIPSCINAWGRIVGAVCAALIAILSGVSKAFGFHDLYINYRTIAETLKKEIHFYNAGADAYADATDREVLFVQRVESLISRENTLWQEVAQRTMRADDKVAGASSLKHRRE